MIEIFPLSSAPKDETMIDGVWLKPVFDHKGTVARIYWDNRYEKWSYANSASFCRNEPDGWMETKTSVFG